MQKNLMFCFLLQAVQRIDDEPLWTTLGYSILSFQNEKEKGIIYFLGQLLDWY
jgi:hypothetical protein